MSQEIKEKFKSESEHLKVSLYRIETLQQLTSVLNKEVESLNSSLELAVKALTEIADKSNQMCQSRMTTEELLAGATIIRSRARRVIDQIRGIEK